MQQPDDFVIIMCGSRTWHDQQLVNQEVQRLLGRYGSRLLIRHGDEPYGADNCIYCACEGYSVRHIEYCATTPRHTPHERSQVIQVSDWNRDGRGAGPVRNRAMRDAGAHGLVAFRMPGVSRGTDGMIALAREGGIPTIVYGPK